MERTAGKQRAANRPISRARTRPRVLATLGFLVHACAMTPAAQAQEPAPLSCGGTFTAVADATVVSADPGGNYGTGPIWVAANAGGEQRGLIAFAPGAGFPRDATVYQARLELTLFELAVAPDTAATVEASEESWSEATVTWDTRPQALPVAAALPLDRAPGQVVSADVTTLFRRWQQGSAARFDLVVSLPQAGQASFFEHGVIGLPEGPRLVVSCAPAPEPPPIDPTTGDVAQQAGIELLQSLSTTPVQLRIDRGVVRFASFDVPVPAAVGSNRDAQALWFLDQFSGLLRSPAGGPDEWQLVRREPAVGAVYFRQLHQGIPVFPSELSLFFADGSVRTAKSLGANYVPDLAMPGEPRLSAYEVEQLALALAPGVEVAGDGPPAIFGDSLLVYLNTGLLGGDDAATYLTWQVQVARNGEPSALFIDAHTGKLRHVRALAEDAFDLEIKDRTGAGPINWPCWQTGAVLLYDEGGAVVANPPAEATAVFGHAGAVDNYWRTILGRDSFDGQGRRVEMMLGIDYSPLNPNASYSHVCGTFDFATQFAQRDVVGHEFTHGVVHFTSNLEYALQSGALNESFADIFGQAVDPGDWLVGENLPNGALRSMSDPPLAGQPDRMPPVPVAVNVDNGGVHTNSGIQNKAAWLLTDGGDFNGAHVVGIGGTKAQRFFYFLLNALTSNAQFVDAGSRANQIAQMLATSPIFASLGFTPADACSVRNAYAAVGLGAPDAECDGVPDTVDPDDDNDGVPDSVDNCDFTPNPSQANHDVDLSGDACDIDDDNDGVLDGVDNCPLVANANQYDDDNDGIGWTCDDSDGDGAFDSWDNCPGLYNPDQKDTDGDAFNVFPFPGGDACDPDDDNDAVLDVFDNCPLRKNAGQQDTDDDSLGDVCDLCPTVQSSDNADSDRDGRGDPCDPDSDGDGVLNAFDNCPSLPNADQADHDDNGVGFACDPEERSATARGLVLRSSYQLSQQQALRIPLPVCPTCGSGPLPPGFALGVAFQSSASLFARVVDLEGTALDNNGAPQAAHSFRFRPRPFGGTGWALGGGLAPAPDGDPAAAVRHYLEIFPGPETPAGVPVTLAIALTETLFADGFEGGDPSSWSAAVR